MKRTRRSIFAKPLLTAGSGLVLSMASCGQAPTGNLMPPPPSVELCITADPKEASVTVNDVALPDAGCTDVLQGYEADIKATATGYQPYEEKLRVDADTHHSITLTRNP